MPVVDLRVSLVDLALTSALTTGGQDVIIRITMPSPSIPSPDSAAAPLVENSPEATLRRLQNRDLEQRRALEAPLLRDQLSCVPFYAKKAKAWEARTGDEMGYWLDLYGSSRSTRRPPEASSTVAKA